MSIGFSTGKPCRSDHGDFRDGCPVCWAAVTSEKHARLFGEPWPPKVVVPYTGSLPPHRRVRLPSGRLVVGTEGESFNCSLLRHRGRLLLAYRTGWAGADVHVAELSGPDYTPGPSTTLGLVHHKASWGREDPRLFVFRGRLHVAFIGVEGPQGPTSQLYARLRDDLSVERVFYPHYAGRREWEKNWGFFEHNEELYAVYSIAPHKILHVSGDKAYPFTERRTNFLWTGGELRGGAPPCLVGDEFVSWFHGAKQVGGRRRYNVGVYTFQAWPPFRPRQMTPDPLLWADPIDCPPNVWADVVFPSGAELEGDTWVVSSGIHDRWCEIHEWSDGDVRSLLRGPTVARELPCVHLGRIVRRGSCVCPRKDTHVCDRGLGEVRQEQECETCPLYEEDR